MLTVPIPNEGDLRLSFVPQAAFDYVRGLALETVTDVQGQIKIINSQIQVLNDSERSQETQITLIRGDCENGFIPADVWFPYLESKLEVQRDRLFLNQIIQVLSAWQTDFFNEATRTNVPKLKVLEAAITELREEIDKLNGVRVIGRSNDFDLPEFEFWQPKSKVAEPVVRDPNVRISTGYKEEIINDQAKREIAEAWKESINLPVENFFNPEDLTLTQLHDKSKRYFYNFL